MRKPALVVGVRGEVTQTPVSSAHHTVVTMSDTTAFNEWIAVDGEETIHRADSELEMRRWAWAEGYSMGDVELVALPQPHNSVIV